MRQILPVIALILLDADLIRAALRHADISISKAAMWMEQDRALLERQLNGEGHLSHKRLLMLPMGFHKWFAFLQVEKYGLPKEVRRAAMVEFAALGHRRQVRMDLQAEQKARTA